jgi:hypothetical protein
VRRQEDKIYREAVTKNFQNHLACLFVRALVPADLMFLGSKGLLHIYQNPLS